MVSPDTGRVRVAEQWAERLGGAPLAFVHKSRDLTVPNQAVSKTVVGQIEGRTCVLIDDMIDTGGTISGAVQVLKNAGAKDVIIAATHAVFSDPAAAAPRRVRRPRSRRHRHPARSPPTSASRSSPCCPSHR